MNIEHSLWQMRYLDELACLDTPVHRLHPAAKLLTALLYVAVLASFPKYEVFALLPMVIYPVVLTALGELPLRFLLKIVLLASPFAFFLGIFNPLFDHSSVMAGNITLSGGWVSLAAVMVRFVLSVMSALILIATTPFDQLCLALRQFRLPSVLVTQLLFLYRYIFLLIEETMRMVRAASLRMREDRGIPCKAWGSLAGQLLLRTFDRAERIYQAMLCRGFEGKIALTGRKKFGFADSMYILAWSVFFAAIRIWNIPQLIGLLLGVKS